MIKISPHSCREIFGTVNHLVLLQSHFKLHIINCKSHRHLRFGFTPSVDLFHCMKDVSRIVVIATFILILFKLFKTNFESLT